MAIARLVTRAQKALKANGESLDYVLSVPADKSEFNKLIVCMPAYDTRPGPRDDENPLFSRLSWANSWPNSVVVSLIDPAIYQHPELKGAWYMHRECDIIHEISKLASEVARDNQIASENIIFYGSSLGGFGALAAASYISKSTAVAEIPQIDFSEWMPSQVKPVEDFITGPIEIYRREFPEQVSLYDRFRYANNVPDFILITNPAEYQFREQLSFYDWANSCKLPKGKIRELVITSVVSGHRVLKKEDVLRYVTE